MNVNLNLSRQKTNTDSDSQVAVQPFTCKSYNVQGRSCERDGRPCSYHHISMNLPLVKQYLANMQCEANILLMQCEGNILLKQYLANMQCEAM